MSDEIQTPRTQDAGTAPERGTPYGAEQTAPLESPGKAATAEPVYFDFLRHERVQVHRKRGIWTYLGQRWGNLEVRLRPFYEEAVVTARETFEDAIRIELSLGDDDQIPAEKAMLITREAVTMAVTGARGVIACSDKMLDIARRAGWRVTGDRTVALTGDEDPEAVRELFRIMIFGSMQLSTVLVRFSRELDKVPDEELDTRGKDFVFGRHLGAALVD